MQGRKAVRRLKQNISVKKRPTDTVHPETHRIDCWIVAEMKRQIPSDMNFVCGKSG
jgi:hypothetical protein